MGRLALLVVASTVIGACTATGVNPAASVGASSVAAGCKVGFSWNNYSEARWAKFDEPAFKTAIEEGGGTYISADARSSAERQAMNVDRLISEGAQSLVILTQDEATIRPAVASALQHGIPVVAYDRLIEEPGILYVTFDNRLVGKLAAQEVLRLAPSGNYVIIKGDAGDANSDFLRQGYVEAGVPGTGQSSDRIKVVGETYTNGWEGSAAQTEMAQFLAANHNKVDAVLAENDGVALGAIAALKAADLAGKVHVSGQDGDAANLNYVAQGLQAVDVWKDSRLLGKAAGDAAIQLCKDKDVSKVRGTTPFDSPGKNRLTSIILTPQAITKANLEDVLDAGWIDKATLCKDAAASVRACL
jgi:D-xylose transport system substrate-binding protein